MKKFLHWLSHFLQGWLGHATATAGLSLFFTWAKSSRDNVKFGELILNWKEIVSPVVVAVLAVLVVALVVKYVKANRAFKGSRETLKMLGVRLFSNHSTPEEKNSDWDQMKSDLNSTSSSSVLWLLGATGKDTFGSPSAPLCEVLRAYKQPVRILLLRPYSKGFDKRVVELNVNAQTYTDQIMDA